MKKLVRRPALGACLLAMVGTVAWACGSDDDEDQATPGLLPTGNAGAAGSAAAGVSGSPNVGAGGTSANDAGAGGNSDGEGLGGVTFQPPVGAGGGAGGASEPAPTGTAAPNCTPPEGALPGLQLTPVVQGLQNPLFVTAAPGDDSRLFVLEQAGRVRVVRDGALLETPFLDVSDRLTAGGEQGLLGLAFHPDYASNGRFFVHYSSPEGGGAAGRGVVSEFSRPAGSLDVADLASEREVLAVDDFAGNHNGGMLEFGVDGFLYIGFGDGGQGGDPQENGQNTNALLAKLLRIDVNADLAAQPDGRQYGIPEGNMTGDGVRPELWSFGLRNPWRFSFDACTNDLYIGDVGQNFLEEIDFQPANAASGRNYGWDVTEGTTCFDENSGNPYAPLPTCDSTGMINPVAEYGRDLGSSVTGGYVYRGAAIPALRGTYVYADYTTGRFWSLRIENELAVDQQEITDDINPGGNDRIDGISSFGQDNAGEVYVTSLNAGTVYRIEPEAAAAQ